MKGRISKSSIGKIKNAIDIVDVIGDFVVLKKAGKDYKGLSPFTSEKTPSFFVVPSKNLFKDFSSGRAGDTFTFLKEKEGLSFLESIEYLARKYNIQLEYDEVNEKYERQQSDKETLRVIYAFATSFFKNNLHETEQGKTIALAYFNQRGIPIDIIKEFELGYSLNQWTNFYENAVNKGYNKETLEKAGLIKVKDNKTYDTFRDRVMFPILSPTGNPIAFGARTLKNDVQPKYINSQETDIYVKSKIIYGIYQAKDEIRKKDNCYITEGYMDVISMHVANVKNTVAAAGTSLTTDQIKLIKRFTSNITMLFDGDRAGLNAMERGVKVAYEQNCNVRIVILPQGEDPDSYTKKHGANDFQKYIDENIIDFVEYKIQRIENLIDEPMVKTKEIQSLCESIAYISDDIIRNTYITMLANKIRYEEEIIYATVNKEVLKIEQIKQRQEKFNEQKSQYKSDFENTNKTNNGLTPPPPMPTVPPNERKVGLDNSNWNDDDIPPPTFQNGSSNFTNQPIDISSTGDNATSDVTTIYKSNLEKIENNLEKDLIKLLIKFGREKVEDKYICDYIYKEVEEYPLKKEDYNRIIEAYRTIDLDIQAVELELFSIFVDDTNIKKIVADSLVSNNKVSDAWEKYGIYVPKDKELLDVYVNKFFVKRRLTSVQAICDNLLKSIKSSTSEEQITNIKIYQKYKIMEMELAKKIGTIITR